MLEHEPLLEDMEKDGGNATPNPSEKERKTLKLVNKLFHKAKQHRGLYDEHWLNYYKMFRGKQWSKHRPSFRHSEVINMVFQNIQSMVPIQTDSRPKISFLPTEPSDAPFAEVLNDVLNSDWENNNWLQTLTEVVYDAHIYGTGLSRLEFDPEANFGLGEVTYERADPFYCFPDPDATDVNKNGEFFIYAEPVCTEKLRKKYPKKKQYIKSDLMDFLEGDKEGDLKGPVLTRRLDEDLPHYGHTSRSVHDDNKTLVITCFVMDKEVVEEKIVENGEEVFQQRLAFPKGRKIVIASGVVLEDIEMPYEDGKFPFSRIVNYINPGEFWGISEVEQLESPQKIFNKLVSFTLDVLTLMGNPVWIVDYASGVDPDNLVNRPGLVVEKEPGTEVRREAGTQLQPYVMQMIDRMKNWFDDISGINEVSRGAVAGSVTAASAIESLQEAAQTRMRLKMRHMDAYLRTVGQQYASRVMQFYSVPRIIRLTGRDEAQQYFRFEMEDAPEGKVATISPFSESGELDLQNQMKFLLKGEFDVRAMTSSGLPFAKAERERRMLALFDRGIVDAEEVMKAIELPGWEAILQRVEEKQAAMAEAQAAQQGV